MREILFRAKRKDIGEMIFGYLAKHKFDYAEEEVFVIEQKEGYWAEVITETIEQFTGLIDKSGKKIFEGDIFVSDYFEDGTKFVVVFEHGAFCGKSERTGIFPLGFANDSDETGCEDDDFYYPDDYSIHIKVVGNIHDNPELLTSKTGKTASR